jgi:hypothetical protein
MTLDEKLQNLPAQPGCYLHKNAKGEIIYIGKAKSLRNRVRASSLVPLRPWLVCNLRTQHYRSACPVA